VVTASRRRAEPALRLAEEFVAVEMTRLVGYTFAHVRNFLIAPIAMLVLLLFAAASYPFRPQHLVLNLVEAVLGAALLLALTMIVQTDRNDILSRIANRTPNRVDFDASFFGQIAFYLALPIAALLVTQFPALGEPVAGLLAGLGRG
jgi:hypothetical protein